jgi:polysaccharide pyruvyl transferase CsaB
MEPETFVEAPAWVGPMYYLSLIGLAKLWERPCILSGVGIGPLRTEIGRAYVREVLAWADVITVRDTGSRDVLQSVGFPEPERVVVTADPVFRLSFGPGEALASPVSGGRPRIGVAVRNWPGYPPAEQWIPELAQALRQVARQTGGTVLFLPLQAYPVYPPTDDVAAARTVASILDGSVDVRVVEQYLSPRQADALVGTCDIVIAMRLHAAILALRHGVPCIGLAYDPKIRHLMTDAGVGEFCFELTSVRRDTLEQMILKLLSQPEVFRRRAEAYRQKALERTALHLEAVQKALQGALPVRSPLPFPWAQWLQRRLTHSTLAIRLTRGFRLPSAYRWAVDRFRRIRHRVATCLRQSDPTATQEVTPSVDKIPPARPVSEPATVASAQPAARPSVPTGPRSIRKVYIVAYSLFESTGQVIYLGGAERYLIELAALIRERGYEVEVYQSAWGNWLRYFYDIPVYGLNVDSRKETINEVFHRRVHPPALTIYLDFSLATPACFRPSIGISHGVFWDDPRFQESADHVMENAHRVRDCIQNLDVLVSVDTNTIQWVRTVAYSLTEKIVYIPNFVDLTVFRPRPPDWPKDDATVVILHPRRLYPPRGFDLLADLVPRLVPRYPHVVFAFVGQAHTEQERRAVETLVETYPGRVRWQVLPFERMPEAYWGADVTVLPTRFAEGTSLACLEAMACGHAVVATPVGGLTDLILDGYNGLLVAPRVDALQAVLERLIEDRDLRTRLGARARETAAAFSIDRWRQAWRHLLDRFLPL